MKSLRIGLLISTVLAGLLPLGAHALSEFEAMDMAASQRMLSQRMMKNYLLYGAGVREDKANAERMESVELFQKQLKELKDYAESHSLESDWLAVDDVWMAFQPEAMSAMTSREAAAELLPLSQQLLTASHALAQAIEKESGHHVADIVNLSGRQSMLSQRIAKAYSAIYWGVDRDNQAAELQQSAEEFLKTLDELKASPLNTAEISKELDSVSVYWRFASPGLDLSAGKEPVPANINTTMESILKKMDSITGMYTNVAN